MSVAQLAASRVRHIDAPYPEGQSYRDVVAATRVFLRDLAAAYGGRTVVVIAHSANKWALDHLLHGILLADLVDAPFGWHEGWHYTVPDGWDGWPPHPKPSPIIQSRGSAAQETIFADGCGNLIRRPQV